MSKKPEEPGSENLKEAIVKNVKPVQQFINTKDNAYDLLSNTKKAVDVYSPVLKPFATKMVAFPCYTAKLYAQAVCQPYAAFDNGITELMKTVKGGSVKYKNSHYNKIYDPVRGKYYDLMSERGQSVIMAYLGKLFFNLD